MLPVPDNEVHKSEVSSDADSNWAAEDDDLTNSDSTHGKNMPLSITVLPDKQTYDTTTSAGLFQGFDLFYETLKVILILI